MSLFDAIKYLHSEMPKMTEEDTYRLLRRSPFSEVDRDLLSIWYATKSTPYIPNFYSFVSYDHYGTNDEIMRQRDDSFAKHQWTRQEFHSALYPKLYD